MAGLDAAGNRASPAGMESLAPLRLPVFRMLWLASFVAQLCTWMNDVAAAWLMTTLTTSPALVALVQSASTLPMFLLGIPSGALADVLDRRRYLIFTQCWVSVVALCACAALWWGALSPALLLGLTFANGIGLAMRWPVFAALVPELVPRPQLPAALALNGITINASRIVGPLVGGLVLATAGGIWVFLLNAVLSLATGLALLRWKRPAAVRTMPRERLVDAMRLGVQHVGQSPLMHTVLQRVVLYFLQAAGLTALLPLVARSLGGAGTFTLLLAGLGAGAVLAVFQLPWMRRRWAPNELVLRGTLGLAATMGVVALAPTAWVAAPAMVLAGIAWIAVLNSLSLAAQMALPNWVRARGMAIYQMALMGGNAAGAALWGQVASHVGVHAAMGAAALCGVVIAVCARRLRLYEPAQEDIEPVPAPGPAPLHAGAPSDGPVVVTVEYRVDPKRAGDFVAVMRTSRRSRLRQGVRQWRLLRDPCEPGLFVESFTDPTWADHMRRRDRHTAADARLRIERHAFHTGSEPPRVRRWIAGRSAQARADGDGEEAAGDR